MALSDLRGVGGLLDDLLRPGVAFFASASLLRFLACNNDASHIKPLQSNQGLRFPPRDPERGGNVETFGFVKERQMKTIYSFVAAFLLGASLVNSTLGSTDNCAFPYLDFSSAELEIRAQWKNSAFSNVRSHDPSHFRYFVHKIDLKTRLDPTIPRESWTYKLLRNPELLAQAPLLSTSIINEKHLATAFAPYAKIGFILSVDCRLIGPMYFSDMGSARPKAPEEAKSVWNALRNAYPKAYTPDALLAAVPKNIVDVMGEYYNEVAILGTHPEFPDVKVRVEAIMVECDFSQTGLHGGTMRHWSEKTSDLKQCLSTYPAREEAVRLITEISKKYPVLLKAGLPYSNL